MSANFHAPLGGAGTNLGLAEPEREHKKHGHAPDLWALVVAQAVVRELPRLSPPSAIEAPSAAGQRPVDAGGLAKPPVIDQSSFGNVEGGSQTDGPFDPAHTGTPGLPARLTTELLDSRLGRMELSVTRGTSGLDIVINVADSHVKALIIADQSILMKSLQDCGLRVASMEIGGSFPAGTALALPRVGAEDRPRGNLGLPKPTTRWQAYQGPLEEDTDTDTERVDVTA
jgi:hypothetical protein